MPDEDGGVGWGQGHGPVWGWGEAGVGLTWGQHLEQRAEVPLSSRPRLASQVPERQCAQLHHQLEGRAGLQCHHPQAQVSQGLWGDPTGGGKKWGGEIPAVLVTPCPPRRPDLIDIETLRKCNAHYNLQNAFNVAERELGLTKLLDPEGGRRPGRAGGLAGLSHWGTGQAQCILGKSRSPPTRKITMSRRSWVCFACSTVYAGKTQAPYAHPSRFTTSKGPRAWFAHSAKHACPLLPSRRHACRRGLSMTRGPEQGKAGGVVGRGEDISLTHRTLSPAPSPAPRRCQRGPAG